MKRIVLSSVLVTALYPSLVKADDKVWFSNKTEVGYGKLFIAEQVKFEEGTFVNNTVFIGAKFKPYDSVKLNTFYSFEQDKKSDWQTKHSLGLRLDFKFK
tara:strand:- start:964 stop:1263 length:300 start_codon:yes stop_codon:yes gene_type:complete